MNNNVDRYRFHRVRVEFPKNCRHKLNTQEEEQNVTKLNYVVVRSVDFTIILSCKNKFSQIAIISRTKLYHSYTAETEY